MFTLANGNFVIASPSCDNGAINSAGAATWGSAVTGFRDGPHTVVSIANSIMGGTANDEIARTDVIITSVITDRFGVVPLKNGNYLVCSQSWDNPSPAAANVGAVTWCNGITGASGLVTPSNSLVGSTLNDRVGNIVTVLPNGNYVVGSPDWNNATIAQVGAATWGSGTSGVVGIVSSANSLVGATANDRVSSNLINALPNGNYVVLTGGWRNGAVANAGAATWGSGTTGITGLVSAANSLVGTTPGDQVSSILGDPGLVALTNGNYLIHSSNWSNGAIAGVGAVTWANGTKGVTGPVSEANSLVGSTANQSVGNRHSLPLSNGNYVVISNGFAGGAATWGSGTTGVTGPVNALNSLVGSLNGSPPGPSAVTALANGNYVVQSQFWNNGGPTAIGAATWCDGTKGARGPITPANSLIGSSTDDRVGGDVIALTNGNYVVSSSSWDNAGIANVGAATWANGKTGIKGVVSPSNSLTGSTANDSVGNSVTALTNGNYVVGSPSWDNGPTSGVGALTWGNGTTGVRGIVSPANSLVGSSAGDGIGLFISTLPNGNYLSIADGWNNGPISNVGAVTWGNGSSGITGQVSPANSLVGTTAGDQVGSRVTITADSNYILNNRDWDATNPVAVDVGAISLGNGTTGTTGFVGSANSVLGTVASQAFRILFAYDPTRNQMIVGRRDSNLVTLFRGDRLRSLAKTSFDAPGAPNIAYAAHGTTAVNADGLALFDSSLTGSGSTTGRNRALFAHSPFDGTELVLQSGTPLSALGGGLPSNTTATALLGQIFNRKNLGLFQATVKGTGISTSNNRLLLLDNGVNVQLLHRTGTPIPSLNNASFSSFTEVLQNHDQNLITIAYKLKPGGTVNANNDEGLFLLDPTGVVSPYIDAREGDPAFSGGGTFGSFTGRAATGIDTITHFTAHFKPTIGTPVPAVFSTAVSVVAAERLAKAGDLAPNSSGASYNTFTAVSDQNFSALVKATLKASPVSQNEGLYRCTTLPLADTLLTRKGDPIGGGLNIARMVRFWPAGPGQVILQVQVTGTNVNTSNNQVLVLRQSDGTYLTLLRTGTPAPGTGPAKLATLSAVDVNPVSGFYAVLGILSGSPTSSNQALWTGNPTLGDNTPALQILRLPQLTLRKGNPYSTDATPSGIIRSIALKPAIDPTGAGGRGLAQALGASGDLALFITGDRNLTELVLLDR